MFLFRRDVVVVRRRGNLFIQPTNDGSVPLIYIKLFYVLKLLDIFLLFSKCISSWAWLKHFQLGPNYMDFHSLLFCVQKISPFYLRFDLFVYL